ncbi:MAG: hypothetical protein KAJ98_05700 [Spirochaetaceae bacterium]|nr:hypothetical protein [Spirochaetaceae bacterium]
MKLTFGMILFITGSCLFSESLTVINRTGAMIELIQAAPAESDQWGDDLIPDQVMLDGETVSLELIGPSPWAFRFLDSEGVVYIMYDVMPAMTGKLAVGPEHQARLLLFAGAEREITLMNRTGSTISSIRISSTTDGDWGSDVLSGRFLRHGESTDISFEAVPGTLSFDIRFTLISGSLEIPYEKSAVILTDGASLVLTAQSRD